MTGVLTRRHTRGADTQRGDPREEATRRHPSESQGKRPQEKPTLPVP